MFRDHAQAGRAIKLLLADDELERLWQETGATDALLLRFERDLHMPTRKRALLLAAWNLWTPLAPAISFGEVVRALDVASSQDLCGLVLACKRGAAAIDAWIAAMETRRSDAPPAPERGASPSLFEGWPTLEVVTARYVARVMEHTKGNRTRAAAMLAVDRRTIGRLTAKGATRR